MKKYQFLSFKTVDAGNYLRIFACTAITPQPIMSLAMDVRQPAHTQDVFGLLYNLVKYTAPVFIFGILYITTRTYDLKNHFLYNKYLHSSWSNLFVPTIWWALIYLLGMP